MNGFDSSSIPGFPAQEEEEPLFPKASDESEEVETEQEELYAVLNVEKTASINEIRQSFRELAALLHPDRHPDPALKSAADSRFKAIQKAYEVLSDPHKRAIYDSLGIEGLKTTWEVGARDRTSAEWRAEFEKMGRKQLEENVEQLVKSKGELTCALDARILFLGDKERRELGGDEELTLLEKVSLVSTRQMFLKHSFSTPVSANTSVVFISQLLARQGAGGGNVLLKLITRPTPHLSFEIGTTVFRPRAMSFKSNYAPDPDTFVTIEFPIKTLIAPPPFSLVFGRRVAERITATCTVRSGVWALGPWGRSDLEPVSSSSITLGLLHHGGWSLHATAGLFSSSLSTDYARVALGGVKFRVGGMISTEGAMSTFLSGERRVTENSRVSLGLHLEPSGTMSLKISLSRLGQKISLPIILSSTFDPSLAVSFTVVPALSVIALNHFVIGPRKRRRVSGRISEMRKEHAAFIAEKKQEATEAVSLLSDHAHRRMETEKARNGLVVVQAMYGVLDAVDNTVPKDSPDIRWLDVTVAVQALVTDSQLNIAGGRSKANLLGFYDCAIGEKKQLQVRYLFKGRVHSLLVEDHQAVAAPLRAHIVESDSTGP